MATDNKKYADIITAEVVGDDELLKFVQEMDTVVSNKIVLESLKKAGTLINSQAKSNFMGIKKDKSKTGYAGFNSLFKIQPIKNPDKVGVKVGISGRDGYKYRWQNWGTVERQYIKRNASDTKGSQHSTGRIQPTTKFFSDAVESTKEQAKEIMSSSIIEALTKIKDANN